MVYVLDLFGVAVFALSGALVAGEKRLDWFGVVVIALVTAIGGGTLRDVLLGATPVFWVGDPTYVWVGAATALASMATVRYVQRRRAWLLVADAFGLSLFATTGAETALSHGTGPSIAIVMGAMSGVAGGLTRDVLCREIPLILQREIYATAALVAAGVFVLLHTAGAHTAFALSLGVVSGLALRLAAIRWSLSLPVFTTDPVRNPVRRSG